MDNTLLQSRIDFGAMKREIYSYLCSYRILPEGMSMNDHTTSTIIAEAMKTGLLTDELGFKMWDIAKKHEVQGMIGAKLEEGALELIQQLHGQLHLAIVTNNAEEAAMTALQENRIAHYFDLIVGREAMGFLKPAPDGYLEVLKYFHATSPQEWLSVGDAWVDGKASQDAGVPFIAYRGDIARMHSMGVFPLAEIQNIHGVLDYLQPPIMK
ncbi:haloacid dehalogenase [Paenibacillus solani]|uniref:Haloacid dehalogenase n=2 Tax=Paenibacillus solani TaxID=1705565 RepID=A0A0M1P7Y1_9BACL|nr:HAD-IA family hydrolase [Paenibacillus solani]KOR90144.1 haloacid dehalogenase [Paenibacillus solani]